MYSFACQLKFMCFLNFLVIFFTCKSVLNDIAHKMNDDRDNIFAHHDIFYHNLMSFKCTNIIVLLLLIFHLVSFE